MSDPTPPSTHGDERAAVDIQHPWLGLLPFREENREYFFGRDEEIEEIVDRIQENALTVLFGQSGLGKSSLLGAGVVPQLRDRGFGAVVIRLDYGVDAPSLLEQTRRALFGLCPPPAEDGDRETLWEMFHKRPAWLGVDAPAPVLVFDQFEEIFTLGRQGDGKEADVAEWLRQIADLLQNRPPQQLEARFGEDRRLSRNYDFGRCPVRMVLALREDYLSNLEAWKVDLPLITQNRMELMPLRGPQALEAVLGPASMGENPLVSRDVAGEIVRTVARVPEGTPLGTIRAVPPLLSLMCERLNAARLDAGAREIDLETVRLRSKDILQEFYRGAFDVFPAEHRDAIRQVVEDPPMVTEGGHRNSVVRVDAEAHLIRLGVPAAGAVFDSLIQSRLITAEDRDGLQRLEITHDVLLPLVLRSREERKERHSREEAEGRVREARARAARTRRRMLVGGIAAAVLVAGFAGLARKASAERSLAKALAAEALALADRAEQAGMEADRSTADLLLANGARSIEEGRWGDAVVQLAAAWKKNPRSEEANLLLPVALRQLEGDREVIQGHPAPVTLMAFTPIVGQMVSGSEDGQVLVRDGSGRILHDLQDHLLAVRLAAFDRPENSETLMATSGDDRRIHIYKLDSGELAYRNLTHADDVMGLQFSPDGVRLLSWSADATLLIHSWGTDEEATEIRAYDQGAIRFACWVEDGSRILAVHLSGKITLWDAKEGGLVNEGTCATNERLAEPVACAALDPSGAWLAVGTRDQGIKLWDVANHQLADTLRGDSAAVWDVRFVEMTEPLIPGEAMLFLQAVYANGIVERWQPHSRELVPDYESGPGLDAAVLPGATDVSADGAFQALGDSGGGLRIFHAPTGQVLNFTDAHHGGCTSLAFAADGMSVWTGGADGKIRLWRVQGRRIVADASGIQCATVHEASGRLLTGGNDGVARIHDPRTGGVLGEFRHAEPGTFVTAVKFDAGGKRLLTAGGAMVRLWDVARPDEALQTIQVEDPHWIRDAAFCQDERAVVVAVRTYLETPDASPTTWSEGDGWRIYDLGSGEETSRRMDRQSGINEVAAFDAHGSVLWRGPSNAGMDEWSNGLREFYHDALSSFQTEGADGYFFGSIDGRLERFNATGFRLWSSPAAGARINHISVDGEDKLVCVMDQAGRMSLFHRENGMLHHRIAMPGGDGMEAVLPAGSALVFGALRDGRVGIFHRGSGRSLLRFARHGNRLARLFYLPGSKTCATVARDGQVWLLDCGWEADAELAEDRVLARVWRALSMPGEVPAPHASSPALVTAMESLSMKRREPGAERDRIVETFREGHWQVAWEALEAQAAGTDTPAEAWMRQVLEARRVGLAQVSQPLPAMINRLASGGGRHFALDIEGGVWSWGMEESPARLTGTPRDMPANRLRVSQDGARFVLGGPQPGFQLCDARDGRSRFHLAGLASGASFGAFAARDEYFYGSGYDGGILGWNLATGEKIREFPLPTGAIVRNITEMVLDARSHLLVTTNRRAVVIDLERQAVELIPEPVDEKDELPFTGGATQITADGKMLIIGGEEPRVYDRWSKELLFALDVDDREVSSLTLMADSPVLIAGTSDGWLYSYSLPGGERLAKAWLPGGGDVNQMEPVDGKPWLIANSYEGGAWLCAAPNLQLLAHLSYDQVEVEGVNSRSWFSLGRGGTHVAISSIDRRIYRWNLEQAAAGTKPEVPLHFNPYHPPLASGGRVILAGHSGNGIEVRHAGDGALAMEIPFQTNQRVVKMHLSPDGKSLLLERWVREDDEPEGEEETREWALVDLDAGAAETILDLDFHGWIDAFVELPGGQGWLLAGSSDVDGGWLLAIDPHGAAMWRWSSGLGTGLVCRAWLPGEETAKGTLLLKTIDGRCILIDPDTGNVVQESRMGRPGAMMVGAAWSAQGSGLVTLNRGGTIQTWDVESGSERGSIHGLGVRPSGMKSSADGRRLLVEGDEGRAEVWDAMRGTRLLSLGLDPERTVVALSPDGEWCLAGTRSGDVRMWHIERGDFLGTIASMPEVIERIVFPEEGRALLIARKGLARIIALPHSLNPGKNRHDE